MRSKPASFRVSCRSFRAKCGRPAPPSTGPQRGGSRLVGSQQAGGWAWPHLARPRRWGAPGSAPRHRPRTTRAVSKSRRLPCYEKTRRRVQSLLRLISMLICIQKYAAHFWVPHPGICRERNLCRQRPVLQAVVSSPGPRPSCRGLPARGGGACSSVCPWGTDRPPRGSQTHCPLD